MPAWPDKPRIIGTDVIRVDGPQKVSGSAKYASDVQPEGWLYGMILRSKWPAAKINSIDIAPARSMPGIKAAFAREIKTVRFAGEELAAVAGVSKQACLDALKAIVVDATPLAFVVNEARAILPESPRVFEERPNLGEAKVLEQGNVEEGFKNSAAIVEGTFSTSVQIHQPLETHGNTVEVKTEEAMVWASTQGIFSVRDGIADNLKMPQNKVRVLCEYMGGGFGAKFGPGIEGSLAAKLSLEAKAPVRLMLTRFDESLAVGNRPSSHQKIRAGADSRGKLQAFDMDAYGTAGFVSGGSSAGGGGGAGFPAPYIYKASHVRVKQAGVAVNAGSARAFRAPGHPQGSFGIEAVLDELAVKLSLDPIEIRLANDENPIRQREWKLAAEKFGWKAKYKAPGTSEGPLKRGIGCAAAEWGGGGRGTKAEAVINPDGTVEIRCGTQDLGTGTKTLIAAIAAEIFGLKPSEIIARVGDTNFPPSGGSGGSTTAASVSPAIYDCCTKALEELKKASGEADPRGANWKNACKKIGINPLSVPGEWIQGLSASGVGGVQMAEVVVDIETGFVRAEKILCVQDCGLVINRLATESQVNGGIIMGLGYALYEARVMDDLTGLMLNSNFENYRLPGAADIPEIEIVLLDMPERGVIGIGEPVTIPTAAAVANAVANAIGVRVSTIPITPARVLEALGKVPQKKALGQIMDHIREERAMSAVRRVDGQPINSPDEFLA